MIDTSPRAALALRNVTRRFGRRWALRGVTLDVQPGEAVAVTGANGSGKSTLLRVAAGAMRMTSGHASVFGHDVRTDSGSVRGLVGLLGHAPGLYDDLTVTENLTFAAQMLALPDATRSVAEAIARAGLEAHAAHRVRTLSSGWQRRVALARLAMYAPRLLLLDEPYNSLDADGIAIVDSLIDEICAADGAALIVTHTLPPARTRLTRVVTLRSGVAFESQASALAAGAA